MVRLHRTVSLAIAAGLAASAFISSGSSIAQDASSGATAKAETSPISRVPAARKEARESGEDSRVIGGTPAEEGAWPFQVALLITDYLDENPVTQLDAQFCGGSLISSEWVLTAAHCLFEYGQVVDPRSVTLLVGATHLAGGERIQAAEIIAHEGYDPAGFDNDVGLIRLAKPASQPAIKIAGSDVQSGAATVTGWGKMANGGFPENLMQADVELFPNDACNDGIRQIYARDLKMVLSNYGPRMRVSEEGIDRAVQSIADVMAEPLTANMICAGVPSGARDACNGDSGGPLFTTADGGRVQVGIVSWGEGPLDSSIACGHENAYGVYTRVANYRDWIGQKTGVK